MLERVKGALFRLSRRRIEVLGKGFQLAEPEVQARLEEVMKVFVLGHDLAARSASLEATAAQLEESFDSHHVGFAFEGAGMHLGMLDLLFPRRQSRLKRFVEGPGSRHDYITCVGAGFAVARLPFQRRSLALLKRHLHPLIGWCVADGIGFHEGFFHGHRFIDGGAPPPGTLVGQERQLFDAGLGRSLWWNTGATPAAIDRTIATFPSFRQGEMWCGIGTACAYAGGPTIEVVDELLERSRRHRTDFLSGIPLAARMRQKGGNPSAATERVCQRLLGRSCEETASWIVSKVAAAQETQDLQKQVRAQGHYIVVRGLLKRDIAQWGEIANESVAREPATELTQGPCADLQPAV